jgi:hypothetical protein
VETVFTVQVPAMFRAAVVELDDPLPPQAVKKTVMPPRIIMRNFIGFPL